MNFPTLPYDNVTYSFLLEIWFWCPTYPTFLYEVTLLKLFSRDSDLTTSVVRPSVRTYVRLSSKPPKGRLQKKKTEKSDIVQKGRVGWTPKPYF